MVIGWSPVRPEARLLVEPADLAELEDLAAAEDEGRASLVRLPANRTAPAGPGRAPVRTPELPRRTL